MSPTSKEKNNGGTSLEVQWLRLHASTAGDTGSIPGHGTKIPHAAWCGQKKKKGKMKLEDWKWGARKCKKENAETEKIKIKNEQMYI